MAVIANKDMWQSKFWYGNTLFEKIKNKKHAFKEMLRINILIQCGVLHAGEKMERREMAALRRFSCALHGEIGVEQYSNNECEFRLAFALDVSKLQMRFWTQA